MDDMRMTRAAGVAGIAVPCLGLALYPIWSFPDTQATGAEVAAWATTHHDRLVAMMATYTVGVTLWLVFGVGVWALLRAAHPVGSVAPACFLGGLIGFVTLLLAGFTAFDLLLYRPHDPAVATLLYDLTFGLLAMSGMPTAVSLAAFAVAVRRRPILPSATVVLAAAAAAAHVLLLASFIAPSGPLSLQGFSIVGIPALLWAWILVTALARPRRTLVS
jgi:hypothetical protein